ncbi:MAG TPA: Crp/Fnr family transcriptional regulator [Methyloradius sp.]
MPLSYSPSQNHLIAALPVTEFERLMPYLELTRMPLGKTLYEPGGQLQHAYFPVTSIVSLHYVLASGASAEFARVGKEGMVGIPLFLGGNSMPSSAMVQTAGYAYRLTSGLLKEEFDRAGVVLRLLLRYTQALATQTCQTVACNRHHSIQQQLCQYLLLTLDRLHSNELIVTQELVAFMLGVRREGISEAASILQRDGFIRSRRGHIEVLERSGLEARTCECYAVVKKEIKRLLPMPN